jgi:hypothetical protein
MRQVLFNRFGRSALAAQESKNIFQKAGIVSGAARGTHARTHARTHAHLLRMRGGRALRQNSHSIWPSHLNLVDKFLEIDTAFINTLINLP